MARTQGTQIEIEQEKARQRILSMPQGAIEWLLRFIRTDMGSLSQGQKSDLLAEVQAFAKGLVNYESAGIKVFTVVNIGLWKSEIVDLVGNVRRVTDLTPKASAIADLQSKLQKALEAHFSEPFGMRFPLPEGLAFVSLNPARFNDQLSDVTGVKAEPMGIEAKSLNDAFYYHAAALLTAYSSRLKRCDACQKTFAVNRTDQVFCSSACMSRIKQQRYLERLKSKND